jgi:hypothetical protein
MLSLLVFVLVLFVPVVVPLNAFYIASPAPMWRPSAAGFESFMASGSDSSTKLTGHETIPELRQKVLTRLHEWVFDILSDKEKVESIVRYFNSGSKVDLTDVALIENKIKALVDQYDDVYKQVQTGGLLHPVSQESFTPLGHSQYPYFGFIPPYSSAVKIDGSVSEWKGECFQKTSAKASMSSDGKSIEIDLTLEKPVSVLCSEHYLIATVDGAHLASFFTRGTHKIDWKVNPNATAADNWDLKTYGIRFFHFRDDPVQLLVDIADTISLFLEPLTHAAVTEKAANHNPYFLEYYTQLKPFMSSRSNPGFIGLNESLIQSGDFFGVIRLDGLDPMLAWAMGSTTGHTTVALRDDKGDLYVAESTTKDSYWPTNGIQSTPFDQWIKQAIAADYNVVWAPLSAAARSKFDVGKAWDFYHKWEGFDYGYHTLLWGWIDTLKDNYPCLPPDYTYCLEWEHIQVAFSWVDELVPAIGDILFNEAFNKRVGTENLRAPDVFMAAAQKGIDLPSLPTIIEQDDWMYQTKRDGKPAVGRSMVCCVFVCSIWKAAGLFADLADEINCAELTNWDVYALTMFDTDHLGKNRPEVCQTADPSNPLCQLVGKYTLILNNFDSRALSPHYAEHCPSLAPNYTHPAQC